MLADEEHERIGGQVVTAPRLLAPAPRREWPEDVLDAEREDRDPVSDTGTEELEVGEKDSASLHELLNEAQDDAAKMTESRDNYCKLLLEANEYNNRVVEWIGEFSVRALRRGKVSRSDLRQIEEGWQETDGRYPWDAE